MYRNYFKRHIDIIFSLILLCFTFPILFIVSILLFISQKRKVFFIQARIGMGGKVFCIYKFKTMNDEKNSDGNFLPDDKRITKIGQFLRKYSIDELPQLINILKGDMSFVGPRPLLPKYLPLYTSEQMRRHEVRPGITGWAQVNGRNNISWKKKFEYDVWYVDHLSFWLDLKILYLTFIKVINREGISKDGFATTEPFNGNN